MLAGFEIAGFDKLQHELERMQQTLENLEGEHTVPFDVLFTEEFMRGNTCYSSFDELLEAGGFQATTNKEFEAIPEKELDAHIAKTTKFKSWEDMMDEAVSLYLDTQLGF